MNAPVNAALVNGALAYLASPYARYPAGTGAAFYDVARIAGRLIVAGVRVYSPVAHTHAIAVCARLDPLDHDLWLPFDEAMMNAAAVLIVVHMAGWQDSVGIAHEVAYFERAGKPIYDCDPSSLMMTRRLAHAHA